MQFNMRIEGTKSPESLSPRVETLTLERFRQINARLQNEIGSANRRAEKALAEKGKLDENLKAVYAELEKARHELQTLKDKFRVLSTRAESKRSRKQTFSKVQSETTETGSSI